jgi:hypothetical protein
LARKAIPQFKSNLRITSFSPKEGRRRKKNHGQHGREHGQDTGRNLTAKSKKEEEPRTTRTGITDRNTDSTRPERRKRNREKEKRGHHFASFRGYS